MTEDAQPRQRKHKRLWLALAALAAILAILIVPPFLSVSRYKSRITQLISASLGRPVRLSSVEVRLLPTPAFLLSDLTVEEDPAYGAEPVLHASSVTASIRLLSLWRGRLEIDTVSVDDASLNLVRSAPGHWNLDSLLRTATAQASSEAGKPDNPGKAALSQGHKLPHQHQERYGKTAVFPAQHRPFLLAAESRRLAHPAARPARPHRPQP
jgi:uncharacterized protein involved in outer membrane biogenesis